MSVGLSGINLAVINLAVIYKEAAAFMNRYPSSRQLKKQKLSAIRFWSGGNFYAAAKYCACFSIGVNIPKFR